MTLFNTFFSLIHKKVVILHRISSYVNGENFMFLNIA